jgi:hypothetical protein
VIRLVAMLGTAALIVWGANRAIETDGWRESASAIGDWLAEVISTAGRADDLVPGAGESEPLALDPLPADGAAEPFVSRRAFEPDLGEAETPLGGTGGPSMEMGAPRALPDPAQVSSFGRVEAEEIRYRLDRVMSLARGPSR